MAETDQKLEKRGGGRERFLGTLAGLLVKIYSWFLRIEVVDRSGVLEGKYPEGVIFPTWHNRLFAIGPARAKYFSKNGLAVMASASKDGAMIAAAMAVFGVDVVRGSSSRRSRAAIVGVMRKIKEGSFVGLTPDGPRGPRYVVQPGLVKLAQACQVPVVPIHVEYSRAWRFNSWDQFRVPKPFSKVTVILGTALDVPRELDDDAFEAQRLRIEGALKEGVKDEKDWESDDQD